MDCEEIRRELEEVWRQLSEEGRRELLELARKIRDGGAGEE